jgi:PAS domain S-box-containing protein
MLNTTNEPSAEDLKRALDAIPDLICILDSGHKVRWMNAAMAKKLGVTQAEATGLVCYEAVHGTTCPPGHCPHRQLLQDEHEHTVEIHEERLGGDFLVTCTPLRDQGGQLVGSVHVARDITKRKRAEEAQARLAQEWQATFDSVNDAIWLLDTDHRILRTNRTAVKFFGRSAESMIGRHCWEIVHGTRKPIPECPVLPMRLTIRREQTEHRIGEHFFE